MKWIGLTGGIGSGKSTVAKYLTSKGFQIIDADLLAHEVTQVGEEGLDRIARTFGQKILKPDGSLDRKALAAQVFSDAEKLKQLEALLHPLIQERARQKQKQLKSQGVDLAFYDVPLLYEKNLQNQFDKVIVVNASDANRLQRLLKRDGNSEAEIRNRMERQMTLAEKVRLADYVIENDGDVQHLQRQVDRILTELKKN